MTAILIVSGINLFVCGITIGLLLRHIVKPHQTTSPTSPTSPIPPQPHPAALKVDLEMLETEKRRLTESSLAFEQLMNYNPTVAYGKRGEE